MHGIRIRIVEICAAAVNMGLSIKSKRSLAQSVRECDCTLEIDDAFKFKSIQHLTLCFCAMNSQHSSIFSRDVDGM